MAYKKAAAIAVAFSGLPLVITLDVYGDKLIAAPHLRKPEAVSAHVNANQSDLLSFVRSMYSYIERYNGYSNDSCRTSKRNSFPARLRVKDIFSYSETHLL